MDILTTIQNAETGIEVGTDLYEHKYSFEEVEAIIKRVKEYERFDFDKLIDREIEKFTILRNTTIARYLYELKDTLKQLK